MLTQASWTFYGVVEDPFVNDYLSVSPAAFGYQPGEHVTASMMLSGSSATLWSEGTDQQRALGIATDLAQVNVDFLFPQTARNWTQADFISPVSLASLSDAAPLADMRALLFHQDDPDGQTLRFDQYLYGGAQLSNDDSLTAIVSGAWVPAGITPELVYGTVAADHLRLSGSLSLGWGGSGDDVIRVTKGAGYAWGGLGDDAIHGGNGADYFWGGIGDDTLTGGRGDDFLNGDFGNDVIDAGAGNDRVLGGSGADLIKGGDGNDILDGGGGIDTILGGRGNDVIFSGSGALDNNDRIVRAESDGGAGNDNIRATFDAILTGGKGSDTFALGRYDVGSRQMSDLIVTDFTPGMDHLALTVGEPGRYDTAAEILATAVQIGNDVAFYLFPEDVNVLPTLVLENVRLNALSSGDFLFGDI